MKQESGRVVWSWDEIKGGGIADQVEQWVKYLGVFRWIPRRYEFNTVQCIPWISPSCSRWNKASAKNINTSSVSRRK